MNYRLEIGRPIYAPVSLVTRKTDFQIFKYGRQLNRAAMHHSHIMISVKYLGYSRIY